MKWFIRFLLVLAAVTTYVGCSEVEFEASRSAKCKKFDGKCIIDADGNYALSGSVKAGRVDILFINDNSNSMYTEQSAMADRFPNFLAAIDNLDYQISMITTDVSASPGNSAPRAANGFGAFQDGKFLKFPNGDYIISNSTPDVVTQFRDTVKRTETLGCNPNSTCPSGDERGIYAANLAVDRADKRFFRDGAHLAIVVLADENERSNGGNIVGYPLETYDLPETLVSNVKATFGPSKTMSVHSVIVAPGDSACLTAQSNQSGTCGQGGVCGYYGTLYAALSNPSPSLKSLGSIVNGVIGSICAPDYGAQLGNMGSVINQNVNKIKLACDPMLNDDGSTTLQVSFSPAPPQQIQFDVDASNHIVLTPPAPAGTKVNYSYKCARGAI